MDSQTDLLEAVSCRERAEAALSLRQVRADFMQVSTPKSPSTEVSLVGPLALTPQPSSLSLTAGIDDLVAALKPRRGHVEGGLSETGLSTVSGKTLSSGVQALRGVCESNVAASDVPVLLAAAEIKQCRGSCSALEGISWPGRLLLFHFTCTKVLHAKLWNL